MREKKYYNVINEWCGRYCKEEDFSKAELRSLANEYRNVVCPAICRYWFGIKRKTALGIADSLGYGNWQRLWLTDEEKATSPQRYAHRLVGEVFYASDRMSWDRLLRINWEYLRLLERLPE